jgi:hypothetical protein
MSGSPYAHRSTHLKKAMYSFVLEQLSSALYVIIARTSKKSKALFLIILTSYIVTIDSLEFIPHGNRVPTTLYGSVFHLVSLGDVVIRAVNMQANAKS